MPSPAPSPVTRRDNLSCHTSHRMSSLAHFIPVPGPVSTSTESRLPAGSRPQGGKEDHSPYSTERARGREHRQRVKGESSRHPGVKAGDPGCAARPRSGHPRTRERPRTKGGSREESPGPEARLGAPFCDSQPSVSRAGPQRAELEGVPISWSCQMRHRDRSPQPRLAAAAAGR